MIESINQAGGAGGVQSVVAGTGISVDNTDPENPIVNSAGIDTDEKAKVSANDTTAGYLNGKLVAGSNITFTENNNGANETLTIAATVPVTSVNTKTGAVTLTNTDVGAAATSHTHAASDITSGVIATARLGSGTADATTYLAGDQTYKAAVTSVNGSTGAVTVAAGDTTYPLTVLDAENTSATRDCVTFTIPGGTLADGEMIVLSTVTETLNNTGGTVSLAVRTVVGGTAASSYSTSYTTSSLVWADRQQIFMWRSGSTFWINLPTTWAAPANVGYVLRTNDNTVNTGYASSTTPNFSNDLSVVLRFQWNTASPNVYLRMRNARAVKFTGQYT